MSVIAYRQLVLVGAGITSATEVSLNILSTEEGHLALPMRQIDLVSWEELVSQYVNLDLNWLQLRLLNVVEDQGVYANSGELWNKVMIVKGGVVPADTRLKDGFWLPTVNVTDKTVNAALRVLMQ